MARRFVFATDQYYHVFNRGIARQPTFLTYTDYKQALLTLSYYLALHPPMKLSRWKELSMKLRDQVLERIYENRDRHVDLISFVLMPNHFHMLVKQHTDGGVTRFMNQFANSYTRYFNTKRHRLGPLFQGIFKAVIIETIEQLLHVSRYIHLNPVVSHVIAEEELDRYPWSSFPQYLNRKSPFLDTLPVLSEFISPDAYRTFVHDQIDYGETLEKVKHLCLDE